MDTKLVTVATTQNGTEARFLVNRLNEAGTEAVVADENLVSMDFLLGNAVGWIKVQVREQDADRAVSVLEEGHQPVDESEIPWDQPPEDAGDDDEVDEEPESREARSASVDEDPVRTEAESLLTRAYRSAIIGLFLFPPILNFFSMIILREARKYRDAFTSADSRTYTLTLWINWLAMLVFSWIWLFGVIALGRYVGSEL